MQTFNSILVPIDFSEPAREALRVAVALSARLDASLTIVHVYEPLNLTLPDDYAMITAQQLPYLIAELERLLASAQREAEAAGGRRVTTQLLQGTAHREIVEFAKRSGSDLIVMGTHGRGGVSRMFLGSVAERVLRTAPCAVMTVRAPEAAPEPATPAT